MEFLRFGSSIPGGYWGCCAVCIIQNFKFDPSAKASIELVSGDGGNPLIGKDRGSMFVGPTYKDIFEARIRIGTFSSTDMPNHAFLAVLTESQISGGYGKQWMEILKENGFEFLRCVDNSVYTGPTTISKPGKGSTSSHKNYLFGLFRNIGAGCVADMSKPPSAWTSLPDPYNGDMSPANIQAVQLNQWSKLGPPKFLTEAEVRAAGAPVTLAGVRKEGAAPRVKPATETGKTTVDPFALKAKA